MAFGLLASTVLLFIASFIKPMIPQMTIVIISGHFYAYVYAPQLPAVNDIIEKKYQGKYIGAGEYHPLLIT